MIVIGGFTVKNGFGQLTNYLYELSGDSEENLTWSLLEQKLDVGRHLHFSLPIPNQLIPSQFVKQEWNICTIIIAIDHLSIQKNILKSKDLHPFKIKLEDPWFRKSFWNKCVKSNLKTTFFMRH